MNEQIAEQKDQIRKLCRQRRQALGEPFRRQASLDICNHIADWAIFQNAHIILSYMPIKAEVDLRPLLESYPDKHWVLPRIATETGQHCLSFHAYDPERLERHPFGMDEPAASLASIPSAEIQLALVPGLAYDRHGWRLGYGGGYYDRFLADFPGTSLGIAFDALIFESLPVSEYDIPMGWMVSERGCAPALQ